MKGSNATLIMNIYDNRQYEYANIYDNKQQITILTKSVRKRHPAVILQHPTFLLFLLFSNLIPTLKKKQLGSNFLKDPSTSANFKESVFQ